MRKQVIVNVLDNRQVKVKELTVRQLYDLQNKLSNLENINIIDVAKDVCEKNIEGITFDEIMDLGFSEIVAIYESFMKVNEAFLRILEKLKIKDAILKFIKETWENALKEALPKASS